MAAVRYSSDVLQMFNGSIKEEENTNLPRPLLPDLVGVYYGFTLDQIIFRKGFACGKWMYQQIMNIIMIF